MRRCKQQQLKVLRELARSSAGLTVDGHQVVEGPGGPVLADWGDALGQQAQDGLKGPAGPHGQSPAHLRRRCSCRCSRRRRRRRSAHL